jgi:F0F1-type ATP synthase assembly protein I
MNAEPDRRRGETARSLGALSAAGLSFVFAIVLGAGGGYLLDGWLGTSPWFFLLGFVMGVAAGVRNVFKAASVGSSSNRTGGS